MSAAHQIRPPQVRGRFPLRTLLGIVVFLIVILSVFHFRRRLIATHDIGFSTPRADAVGMEPQVTSRSIVSSDAQFMTLDPTGKFLINSITRKPVFITGDDAWSLITQLDNSDVDVYLSDRASRGFNYIWCAAADNYSQSNAPHNFYGDSPFDGADFTREDAAYWAHVDSVVERARFYGITVALSPGFVGLTPQGGYLNSYQNSSEAVLTG